LGVGAGRSWAIGRTANRSLVNSLHLQPHLARHLFISTMQAQGIEVGLVAKLAGHASAVVTLSHYTQAGRGGEAAVAALEQAFAVRG
jgi:integrase